MFSIDTIACSDFKYGASISASSELERKLSCSECSYNTSGEPGKTLCRRPGTTSVSHMSNTPYLSWMDIPGVRSCLKTYKLQIVQAAFCPYNVCVGQPSTCVLPHSKKEQKLLHFTQYFSIGPSDTT